MNDGKETKLLWTAEVQLHKAAQLLSDPSKARIPEIDVYERRIDLRRHDIEKLMIELEMLASEIGCKSGFWRKLQRVAETIDAQTKIGQYEAEFHKSLARNA